MPNKDFISQAERIISREGIGKDGTIFVMCRSGGRSAMAAKALAQAGYTNVWNLVEGFEGDKDDQGVRSLNGWRNAGLPWIYKLTPQQAWISTSHWIKLGYRLNYRPQITARMGIAHVTEETTAMTAYSDSGRWANSADCPSCILLGECRCSTDPE